MDKIIKRAYILVEHPASVNPEGRVSRYLMELKENETLEAAQERFQDENWPFIWKWKTVHLDDGSYKREKYRANYYKIPLVVGAYMAPDKIIKAPDPPKPKKKEIIVQVDLYQYLKELEEEQQNENDNKKG